MKKLLLLTLLLVGCTSTSGVKVIVGAKLGAIDYSVVVIEAGKITAAGPQSQIPVPKGSEITSGIGMTLVPDPDSIEPGHPANLILKGPTTKKMHNGAWVQ
jgi:hypothetical protein